jgi:hypothetical protein
MIRVARTRRLCDSPGVALPRIIRSASEGAERLLDRVLCVAGAVLFSQFPEFIQQYFQRLGGSLSEARTAVSRYRDVAAKSGMSLDQLIADSARNPDPSMVRLGGVIGPSVARLDKLAAADEALRNSTLWGRPFSLVTHLDWGIARATAADFKPAVPTTVEGLVYAGVGIILVLAAYHLAIRGPIARYMRMRKGPLA